MREGIEMLRFTQHDNSKGTVILNGVKDLFIT